MENHPIPQDVTGFQFRLIGNMTVRQFAYLATGCVAAFIAYSLPIFILIKVIFVPLFAFTGVALAFLPIEGRPMDAMLSYFFKALFSPNQYIYQRNMGHFSFDTITTAPIMPVHLPVAVQKRTSAAEERVEKQKKLKAYLETHKAVTPTDKKELSFLERLFSQNPIPQPQLQPQLQTQPEAVPNAALTEAEEVVKSPSLILNEPAALAQMSSQPQESVVLPSDITHSEVVIQQPMAAATMSMPLPSPIIIAPDANSSQGMVDERKLEKEKQRIQEEKERLEKEAEEARKKQEEEEQQKQEAIAKAEEEAKQAVKNSALTHDKVLELETSLQSMASEKQKLQQELEQLKSQLTKAPAKEAFVPSVAKDEPKQQTQLVRQIPKDQAVKKGLPPTPDVPNILLGVVKDSSENILPNILIEVKDHEGNPVRAFKTNQLGQFASATPLTNGTYTIDFEDTKGKNKFDTIELVVDGKILLPIEVISHDLREELRKQLFN